MTAALNKLPNPKVQDRLRARQTGIQGKVLSPAWQDGQGMRRQGHCIAHAVFGNEQTGVAPCFGQAALKIGYHGFLAGQMDNTGSAAPQVRIPQPA